MRFTDKPDRWVILTLTEENSGWLVAYEDDRGRVPRKENVDLPATAGTFIVAADVDSLLAESLAAAARFNTTLTLFVSAFWDGATTKAAASLSTVFPSLGAESRWQLVRMFTGSSREVSPFTLPFDLAMIGSLASSVATQFLAHSFVAEAEQNGAMTISERDFGDCDVMIAEGADAASIAASETSLRLLIVLDTFDDFHLKSPPRNAVIVLASAIVSPSAVDTILFGIVHDHPLHAALPDGAILFATPESDHSLRMSDAFAAVAQDALADEISMPNSVAHRGLGEEDSLLALPANFMQERTGLLPLSRYRMSRAVFEGALPAPESFEGQRRRVDARIERVDYIGADDHYAPSSRALWIPKNRSLRRGGRYRLRIQIGRRVEGNLIPDSTPDLLLPPTPRSHYEIDVALFPKNFVPHSPLRQTLRLPKGGASSPLWFEIVAPDDLDSAQLRFGIYLGNQLLQSFLLSAKLSAEEAAVDDGIVVALEVAKSEGFANLDELRPRALSIGMNLDADGQHTLCFKLNEAVAQMRFLPAVLEEPLKAFRAALEDVAIDDQMPIFTSDDGPRTAEEDRAFEKTMRRLAAIGAKLHVALFERMPRDVRDLLRQLVRAADLPLQFSRYDVNFSMPWPALYDFSIPRTATAAVCRGVDKGKPCGHKPDDDVYCINGFWGIRHVIDEQLANGVRRDATLVIESPAGTPIMRASDAPDDGNCQKLVDGLTKLRPNAATRITAQEDVLDLLWSGARPAVMMFLGHLEEPSHRVQTAGTVQWLSSDDLERLLPHKPEWERPRTIVLLMACSVGQMTATTLSNHSLAFVAAGAAAVVGPECTIFPTFACRFVGDILRTMLTDKDATLGRAISTFRRRTVASGNPLAFAFSSFGEADVTIR